MEWAYGLTTVPQRRQTLLPRTLRSLEAAGFPTPRLFVDGDKDIVSWEQEFHLEVTVRSTQIHTAGHWVLSLTELYIRQPLADRYVVFQDDFITYKNLRHYLERCEYPETGYWNLYTFPSNQKLAEKVGWYLSNQFGRGAVALVFSRKAVVTLLTHQHIVERPQDINKGRRSIDGGIVTAFTKAGWKEWVHNPSLVQHTGVLSSMKNRPHPLAISFRGESFDANCL